MTTLAARSLTKRFGTRTALDNVSFELTTGELVAIIGPNGAGKTTLLSILAGVLPASDGEVTKPATEIGWVPQQPALYSKLSVAENLRLFARLEKLADPEAAVDRMLEQTGLRERADEAVGRLSGGNQQRVNIAIGLLSEPGGPASRRAVGLARSAPTPAAVGIHRHAGRAGDLGGLLDPQRGRGRA